MSRVFNLADMTASVLRAELQDAVYESVVKKFMSDFEATIRPLVKSKAESITLDVLEHTKQVWELADRIDVKFTWTENN